MNLESRITNLERSNRNLKIALGGMLAVVGCVFALGQAARPYSIKEVEATRFVLKSPEGAIVGSWVGHRHGSEMNFYGDNLVKLMTIVINAEEKISFIQMNDAEGIDRLSMNTSMVKNGGASIEINEGSRKPKIKLFSNEDGTSIGLYDKEGNRRAVIGNNYLINTTSEIKTDLPESSIVLFDSKGKVIFQAPMER